MGFTATRTMISCPLAMPPKMPPALLDKKPSGVMASLLVLPVRRAAAKPAPTSTPFTAPTPMKAYASRASSLSNTGSPRPAGTPLMRSSTTPPRVSPALFTARTRSSQIRTASASALKNGRSRAPAKSRSLASIPPSSTVAARTSMPRPRKNSWATAPPATRETVSRPEERPPPR